MYQVTLDYAKEHLEEIINRAKNNPDGVRIIQDNTSFILIDQDELEARIETAELIKEPDLLSDIYEAREEYQRGETVGMDDVFILDR